MNKALAAGIAVITLAVATPERVEAKPGGCLKYGLGGAIAGHFAGGHRLKGAAAGCALGYVQRRRHENAQRDRLRDRDRDVLSGDTNRNRSSDRGFARDNRERYDPEETGNLRRRAPGTDY